MIIKALTFNKQIVEDTFFPYVNDIVKETVRIIRNILDTIPSED